MATTYNASQLATSEVFRARFALGDKGLFRDKDGGQLWLLLDEEIQFQISTYGYAEGVAQCADALATQYAQDPDEYADEGGVKVKWGQKVKTWKELAEKMRSGITRTDTAIVISGAQCGQLTNPDLSRFR